MRRPIALVAALLLAGCGAEIDSEYSMDGQSGDELTAGYEAFSPASDLARTFLVGSPDDTSLSTNLADARSLAGSDRAQSVVKVVSGRTSGTVVLGFPALPAGTVADVIVKAVARTATRGTLQLDLMKGTTIVGAGASSRLTSTWSRYTDSFTGLGRTFPLSVKLTLTGDAVCSTLWIEVKVVPDASTVDAGTAAPDAGTPTADAGTANEDAGTAFPDAGTTPTNPFPASATGWDWSMSGVHGGGQGLTIATDPFHAGGAVLGGDSWGVYKTDTWGNDWYPATKGHEDKPGTFYFAGVAYSRKHPGLIYGVTGRPAAPAGGFFSLSGYTLTFLSANVTTGENGLDRTEYPRSSGNRLVVDYDRETGVEYLYVCAGDNGGLKRSTDGGKTWTAIALAGQDLVFTGMALDPTNPEVLFVGAQTGAWRVDRVRGSATALKLSGAPPRVEEIAAVGGQLYAACNTYGIYKLSNGGQTWTRLGASFFSSGSPWASIGGSGNTLYAGCAYPQPGQSIARSTDGGLTWKWVSNDPSRIINRVWGSNEEWWLGKAEPRVMLGNGTYVANQIAVDAFNPQVVYVAGRSGCWKSEDGGDTWRPATRHLGGTMHTNIAAGPGGQVSSAVLDWDFLASSDNYRSVYRPASAGNYGGITLDLTKNGHRYQLVKSVPRDFLLDGKSIADEYFRAAVIRAEDIDVSEDGQWIYIAQYGGGVVVGHRR